MTVLWSAQSRRCSPHPFSGLAAGRFYRGYGVSVRINRVQTGSRNRDKPNLDRRSRKGVISPEVLTVLCLSLGVVTCRPCRMAAAPFQKLAFRACLLPPESSLCV